MQNWRGNAPDNISAFNTTSFVNHIWTESALPKGLFCIVEYAIFFKGDDFSPHCRNPTLAKCGGEAQHLEKLEVGSLPGLPNV
jgi:hypothetical protein